MESPLRNLDNVILTPHAVGYTKENVDSLRAAAVENIRRVVAGQPPLHCKNPGAVEKWTVRVAGMDRLRGWDAPAQR
jgi:D-3-phosphoglycerate dehydrogenase